MLVESTPGGGAMGMVANACSGAGCAASAGGLRVAFRTEGLRALANDPAESGPSVHHRRKSGQAVFVALATERRWQRCGEPATTRAWRSIQLACTRRHRLGTDLIFL